MLHSKAVDLMDPAEVLAGAALRAGGRAESLGTGHSGSKAFANADGTWTVVGPQAGDATIATHVGDTVPPPVPTGIAATSVDGTVAVTWDGTLEGDVPADFYRVNLYVDGVWFAALAEAGSALTPPQEVGATVEVTATSEDDACLWDGTPAHNVSEPCAPVEVVVRDLFAEGAAELDAAREEAREAIDAVDRTAAEAAQAVAGAVAAAGEAKDAADAASSAADELRRTAATKTEVTQAVDAAKGEVLTSVAADYVDKETGATLATKSEVSQTADSIRSEVSEAYATKESTEGLASRSELEQTATSIRAEVARDYVDKATGATYATKSELKVESDSIRAEVGEVAETADGAVDRAAALEVAADAIRADVASTAKTADAAISKATSVEQTASGLSAKITETATKADQTATKVTDLSATVDGVSSSVAKAQQTADGAATAASRAQQTADSITSTVEANYLKKGDAASLYAGKTEVKQTTDAIRLTAEESLRKVEGLEVGGTNLILESDTPNRGASATGYPSARYPLSAHVESGQVYTATLWWSGNSGGVKWCLYFGGDAYGTAWKAISGASGTSSITFTANANMAAQGHVCVYVRDSRDIASFNGSITVLQVKLEKGNMATDWSPAPEDADATYATKAALSVESDRITGVVSEQAGLANRVSTVEQTASGLTVTLGKVEGKADDAAKVATNFLSYTSDGLVIADQTGDSVGSNVQIKPNQVNVRNGAVTNASFAADRIQLGINSYATEVDMCRNVAEIKVNAVEDQGAVKDVTAIYAVKAPGDMARSTASLTCLDYSGNGTSVGVQAVHEPSKAVARNAVSLLLGGDAGWKFGQDGGLWVRSVKGESSTGANINRNLTGQQVDILLSMAQDQDWYVAKRVTNLNALWKPCLFTWGANTVGIPVANSWGMGICIANARTDTAGNWAYQLAKTTSDTGEVWVRQSINAGGWTAWRRAGWDDTGWRKLAGTYDTPVGHDGTNGLYYRKTGQTVTVYVNGGGTWGPSITTAGTVLGTLPAGYRPDAMLCFMLAPKGAGAHRLEIYPNGQIKGVANGSATAYYAATASFPV